MPVYVGGNLVPNSSTANATTLIQVTEPIRADLLARLDEALATPTPYATTTTPGRGTTAMPTMRDSRGRFTSSVEKTPVTTVEEAADALRHFTQLMNSVADDYRLCSQFGVSVTRAVGDTPGVMFEAAAKPEYEGGFIILGRIRTPVGAKIVGRNEDYRRENARKLIDTEFEAWCAEHSLDHTKVGSWFAWADTLPEDRFEVTAETGRRHREIGLDTYFVPTDNGRKLVTFRTEAEAEVVEAVPGAGADPADLADGDHVRVLRRASLSSSRTHALFGRAFSGYPGWEDGETGFEAEVVRRAGGGGGYALRPVDNRYGYRTQQTVAIEDLEAIPVPAPAPAAPEPATRTFEVGDQLQVLHQASDTGSRTEQMYGLAFESWPWDAKPLLVAEVISVRRQGGEIVGYEVHAVDRATYRYDQSVAVEDVAAIPTDATPAPTPDPSLVAF